MAKARYKNPWYDPRNPYSVPEFEADSEPVPASNGCLVYERREFGYPIFDVVKDGVCVTQRAGPNGARRAAEAEEWKEQAWWRMKGVTV